jgi:uncharacterized protein (DUF2336 family)
MTVPTPTVFDDILDLTLAREAARRPTLVRVLADGFARDAGPRTREEVRQFAELMTHLLPQVDVFTRATVAQRIAARADAPWEVVGLLALDEEPVAELVVAMAPRLPDDVLSRLAARAEGPTAQALARRSDLTDAQRRILAARGVIETPLARRDAPAAVALPAPVRPEVSPAIAPPPEATRPRRPPSFLDASSEGRRRLLAALAREAIPVRVTPAPPDTIKALVRLAVLRRADAFANALSEILGVTPAFVARLAADRTGEGLVVAFKVMGLDETRFETLLAHAAPHLAEDMTAMMELRALYSATSVEVAAIVLSVWRAEAPRGAHAPVTAPARPQSVAHDRPAQALEMRGTGTRDR